MLPGPALFAERLRIALALILAGFLAILGASAPQSASDRAAQDFALFRGLDAEIFCGTTGEADGPPAHCSLCTIADTIITHAAPVIEPAAQRARAAQAPIPAPQLTSAPRTRGPAIRAPPLRSV
ncbi:hypothetical protein IV417_01915 [Alphaproteobacteria bacterium KMM 3653]|uniref:DUF2946 domain-containing protein n=1 Tax=Harenicola maris TaxID=2841044 RepID=A0AAP2G763_9RHOB|nr:hypothetical protein [Harenicola maris]